MLDKASPYPRAPSPTLRSLPSSGLADCLLIRVEPDHDFDILISLPLLGTTRSPCRARRERLER